MSDRTRMFRSPYKGLSAYGPDDVELFAAREGDVSRIAYRLADPETAILILHGRTGCGKSSFLRAGLIPRLELPGHGFQFLREASAGGASTRALFVRCTEDPLSRVAEEIWNFCLNPYFIGTPIGGMELDLSPVIADYLGARERFLK